MKNYFTIFLLVLTLSLSSQTIWIGDDITFTKADNTDHLQEENQDRITDNVWITRLVGGGGIFNIAIEDNGGDPCFDNAPGDTEWAFGDLEDWDTLSYVTLGELIGCAFNGIPNQPVLVMHLISEDIYLSVDFTSWTSGGGTTGEGGGFSYNRSSDEEVLNLGEVQQQEPSVYVINDQLIFSNLEEIMELQIFNIAGKEVMNTQAESNIPLSVANLTKGIYLARINNEYALKFIKN